MANQPQISSPTAIHPALSNLADHPALHADGLKKHISISDRPKSSSAALTQPLSSGRLSLDPAAARTTNAQNHDEPASASIGPSVVKTAPVPAPAPPAAAAAVGLEPVPSRPAPFTHRQNALSIESIPRQTVIKALASVARKSRPEALSLAGMLSAQNAPPGKGSGSAADGRPATSSSQQLCDALNGLASAQHARGLVGLTPTTALPALQSPCFYHNRFDDAVDIDKVLEEIKNDEWMSHSRLVQTATGVREVSKQLQRRPIRRAVRNIMIVTKARDNQLVLLTRELTQWLLRTPRYGSEVGVNVYVDAKLRHSKRFDAAGITEENPRFQDMLKYWTPDLCWTQPEKFDLVLTLGGDGTVLFTSWLFQRVVPPILSFSLGSLGFLTTFEFERYKDHLNRIMGEEGMRVNLRMRFTCTVYRDGPLGHEMEEGEQFEVLNELVIDRGPSPYVSNLELYGDNELLTVVQADGCIFSTPTGTIFHSLSPVPLPLSPLCIVFMPPDGNKRLTRGAST